MAEQSLLSEQDKIDLVAFLDGELTGAPARRIEARLSLEPAVRAEAAALKQAWDMLDLLPHAEPSPLFTSRTVERLTISKRQTAAVGSKQWQLWASGLGWVASLLFATWIGFAGFNRPVPREPTEMDLVQDLRLIENKRLYDLIDDLEFLHELDHPDLFGEEVMGS